MLPFRMAVREEVGGELEDFDGDDEGELRPLLVSSFVTRTRGESARRGLLHGGRPCSCTTTRSISADPCDIASLSQQAKGERADTHSEINCRTAPTYRVKGCAGSNWTVARSANSWIVRGRPSVVGRGRGGGIAGGGREMVSRPANGRQTRVGRA